MRIAFVHNKYIDYRVAFFKSLSEKFNIIYYFEKDNIFLTSEIISKFSTTFRVSSRNINFSIFLPFKLLYGKFDLLISGDLGYANTIFTFLVSQLTNKPFIVWSEEWHPHETLKQNRFQIKKLIVRQSNACIAAGRKSAAFLKYLGAKEEKVFLAPNASIPKLKDEQIQLSTLPESIFRSDMIKILCLGRIIESKGLDFLIKAFNLIEKECSRTILIIAGDGPYSRQIENLGRQENIKKMLFVKQYMNSGDKIRLFQNCDIFVLPSVYHGYVDAWGLVLNEAMYFGKPVVATEMVGAAHDLIENGINGYIVPEKNAEALSEALIKIIHDDQLRKSMGLMSKQIIERRYKVSHMVKGFEDAINFVLSDVE